MGKAFIVTEEYGNNAMVVFSNYAIAARRYAASELNGGEITGLSVRRAKDLDQFEGDRIPASILIERGWWFECSGCGLTINEENLDERDLSTGGVIGFYHGAVYCCKACHDDHMARKARENEAGQAFLAILRGLVTKRLGAVEFVTGAFKEHIFAQESDGIVMIRDACVSFNFPGQTLAPASLHYQPGYDCGPNRPEFRCCAGDKDAFEAFADKGARNG